MLRILHPKYDLDTRYKNVEQELIYNNLVRTCYKPVIILELERIIKIIIPRKIIRINLGIRSLS